VNSILKEDLDIIYENITPYAAKFLSARILITGCSGFIGFELTAFLITKAKELGISKITLYDLNFPDALQKQISSFNSSIDNGLLAFKTHSGSCIRDFEDDFDFDFVFHLASIASPVVYRQLPLETIHTNTIMLKELLDLTQKNTSPELKGFLVMSSSEIYGDPDSMNIPTKESYNGNVSCIGPRACYDESKRLAETIAWIYREKYNMNVRVARPFNNFGPGLALKDGRLAADLARSIIENKNIVLHSDGSPTRSFCYVSDAVTMYLLHILSQNENYTLNIGSQENEITVGDLAKIYSDVGVLLNNYENAVIYEKSEDPEYLSNNPNRRCPDVKLATETLSFSAKVPTDEGVKRYINYLLELRDA